MKNKFLLTIGFIGMIGVSCNKLLNINTNPNATTTSSPDLVLPLAITNTASLVSSLNDYGGQTVGYMANAGGYGGFGATWTYNYPTTQGNGYWASGYSILENLQSIINISEGNDSYTYYGAAARILKSYVYEMLVDEFNNIPYSDALKGSSYVTPKYDDAASIYVSLANNIDSAITEINSATTGVTSFTSGTDPLFSGNMTYWKQFANTLKLRLIIRASSATTFSNTTFTTDGFLADDAIVNPGYKLATGEVNPSWGTWVASYTGSAGLRDYNPTYYIMGYYNGAKLSDSARGAAIFYNFPKTPVNQMGVSSGTIANSPATAGAWYSGTGSGTGLGNAIGVMKGPNMGEPLMLLAESDFLQAEADVRGILTQDAKSDFNKGIAASFNYLYKLPTNILESGLDPAADATSYITKNSTSYLANFDIATTTAEKIEAIITQKYIALDFINGAEAWNEYRRTGYPATSTTVTNNAVYSFASTQSQATRPDHLPTRLPYPSTEYSLNSSNVPSDISVYTSLIFWAK
ncbi:SusD/RagB family nutrient-binding outer membrane lipoprotein [Rhizosphaericola mali]|uniref:SusD/RagB family nutrient-binding outer membrane lipoprotein n=1 Tax=Rhizosphaericola mali TaxID=2545455 RepID=A0A5P2G1W6_9BACT|nr:SusD/RagB family nutrient-binding outer membrane lipoprotein [Rhizosphaericola mali]QES89806.1 SusD/RagB family nutrient-binding outer membrane lipoprotein [Rhizosphaericola mali]